MHRSLQPSVILILLSGFLATVSGCSSNSIATFNANTEPLPAEAATAPTTAPVEVAPANAPSSTPVPAQPDPYPQAINRASSAFNISQSAQSQDDWRLVASRWQQAIELMSSVPAASPHHGEVQRKVAEYRRNLAYAQQQANRSTASANADGVVVITRQPQGVSQVAAPDPVPVALPSQSSNGVYQAPIVGRAGGTPVIMVTFDGSQQFPMIVDTGASGTLITPRMATALSVVPVGEARIATASARSVAFPLGYVRSIEVEGAVAQNVLVAVSGSELEIGLLGHDFFGNYDVTIRENVVEFRER